MGEKKDSSKPKKKLSQIQFEVTQKNATEPAFSGELLHNKKDGTYKCICCEADLFQSSTKFDSGSGWPSFYEPLEHGQISYQEDLSTGTTRIEISCKKCGAHLGHVFDDGPKPTGKRYCVNSASLCFHESSKSKGVES